MVHLPIGLSYKADLSMEFFFHLNNTALPNVYLALRVFKIEGLSKQHFKL